LAHLIRGVAQSLSHPTDKNRTLWEARDDAGPFTGPPGFNVELGADVKAANALRASMDADDKSVGVHPLGSGSDYTVFLQRIGVRKPSLRARTLCSPIFASQIASIDGGFAATHSDAVYHYHSVYDSHRWESQFSDPGFFKHVAMAKYLGLVTLRVADSIILPINTTQYTLELESYLSKYVVAGSLFSVPRVSVLMIHGYHQD
jgi:N-acetylated-alpha-linked acidic dipeptidase